MHKITLLLALPFMSDAINNNDKKIPDDNDPMNAFMHGLWGNYKGADTEPEGMFTFYLFILQRIILTLLQISYQTQ